MELAGASHGGVVTKFKFGSCGLPPNDESLAVGNGFYS